MKIQLTCSISTTMLTPLLLLFKPNSVMQFSAVNSQDYFKLKLKRENLFFSRVMINQVIA